MGEINFLVPRHRKLSEEEILVLFEKYNISDKNKLPKIKLKDFGVNQAGEALVCGDIIEITRESFVGDVKYFRVVE